MCCKYISFVLNQTKSSPPPCDIQFIAPWRNLSLFTRTRQLQNSFYGFGRGLVSLLKDALRMDAVRGGLNLPPVTDGWLSQSCLLSSLSFVQQPQTLTHVLLNISYLLSCRHDSMQYCLQSQGNSIKYTCFYPDFYYINKTYFLKEAP